jgi:nitrogen regulatory protein PII
MRVKNIKALFIVVNAGFVDEIIDIARAEGARGATIINARGEGLNVEKIMGITVDSEKEMVLSLVDEDTAEKIMAAVKEKAGICTPAHGVCFMLPVEKMTGTQ